jgi:hypothetical protein
VHKLINIEKGLANGLLWCMPIEKKMTNKILEEK